MKKGLNYLKTNALSFIVGAIVFGGIGVVIAEGIASADMAYSNEKSPRVTNVEEALNDLYNRVPNNGPNSNLLEITDSNLLMIINNNDSTLLYKGSSFHDYENFSGGLVYHDGTFGNDANDYSFRYSGPNINVNNWVCFGYDDESYCSNENFSENSEYAYRIIGWFDNGNCSNNTYKTKLTCETNLETWTSNYQIKLIKNVKYANNYWAGSYLSSASTKVEWAASTLNTTQLNQTYYNTLGEKWQNMIINPTWNVGGCSDDKSLAYCAYTTGTAKGSYTDEMTGTGPSITGNNKIGLIYVNDYTFATLPLYWSTVLKDYQNAAAAQDWLFLGSQEWTISKNYYERNYACACYINEIGRVNCWGYIGSYNFAVRPVMYLDSNVEIVSGNGTTESPYFLSFES